MLWGGLVTRGRLVIGHLFDYTRAETGTLRCSQPVHEMGHHDEDTRMYGRPTGDSRV